MRSFKLYAGIVILLLGLYVVAQINKPKPINWQTTMYYNDKIPFGTYIFYHELQTIFPSAKVERINKTPVQAFADTVLSPGNYIIVAKSINLNKDDYKAMLKFIEAGNSVFMTAGDWGGELADKLKLDITYGDFKGANNLNFTNPNLKRAKDYVFDNTLINQQFAAFDTAHAVSLSRTSKGLTNFIKVSYGKGNLYLLCNPYLVTNYGLLNTDAADYTAKALSYLPDAKHVYWDQYQNHDIPEDVSPMRVLLDHDALRYAWYLTLASLILYVLYEMKRRQRIIPVIAPLRNASVDFASIVGRVYYEQRDNADIAAKKIKYLFDYMRSQLYLRADISDRDFIERLVQKTGLQPPFIQELVDQIMYTLNQSHLSDAELIRLNNLIDKFYAQTK